MDKKESIPHRWTHHPGLRRTKIVVTLGPATDKKGMLKKLILAGVNLFRINYSHGDHEEHARRVHDIRKHSTQLGREVAIMGDLQGPKVRVRRFSHDHVTLKKGQLFTLDTKLGTSAGDKTHVGISYKNMPRDVEAGDDLLLDDGRIALNVLSVSDHEVRCQVVRGGELSSNKGVNLRGGGLSMDALTDKDREDLRHAATEAQVDYIAVSFVQDAADIELARQLLQEVGHPAHIIAKIERASCLENITSIIEAADAIMIARGDLGVEVGDARLPKLQKDLIRTARQMDRVTITATQMLESMIDRQIPLRAEVFDIANAVLDGTDAVMLSGETSIGMFPDLAVQTMAGICEEAEKERALRVSDHRINQNFHRTDEGIAMAAMYTAHHVPGTRAIAALTETGATCRWMSRISSGLPIYALTPHVHTRRRVMLYRGVYPVEFDPSSVSSADLYRRVIQSIKQYISLDNDDLILVTRGDQWGHSGGTNTMKLLRVGDTLTPAADSPAQV